MLCSIYGDKQLCDNCEYGRCDICNCLLTDNVSANCKTICVECEEKGVKNG